MQKQPFDLHAREAVIFLSKTLFPIARLKASCEVFSFTFRIEQDKSRENNKRKITNVKPKFGTTKYQRIKIIKNSELNH